MSATHIGLKKYRYNAAIWSDRWIPSNGYPVDEFDPDPISIARSNISVVPLLRQNAVHVLSLSLSTQECNLSRLSSLRVAGCKGTSVLPWRNLFVHYDTLVSYSEILSQRLKFHVWIYKRGFRRSCLFVVGHCLKKKPRYDRRLVNGHFFIFSFQFIICWASLKYWHLWISK